MKAYGKDTFGSKGEGGGAGKGCLAPENHIRGGSAGDIVKRHCRTLPDLLMQMTMVSSPERSVLKSIES